MNIFGNLTKNITNLLGGNNPDSLYRQNFINKTHEELVDIASTFADENHIIKEQINTLMKENELLKNSIISNGSEKSSTFGKFYKDMKNTLLNIDDESAKEEGDGFKQFLYDQFLFYGGLEEEDIHNLNQMNFSDAEWEKSREIYMFKQNILFKNIQYSDGFSICIYFILKFCFAFPIFFSLPYYIIAHSLCKEFFFAIRARFAAARAKPIAI